MKFTIASVISLSAISTTEAIPSVRKVPPRTPPQRLDTLNRFANEYINNLVRPARGARADKNERIAQRQLDAMMDNYDKIRPNGSGLRRCSFFDPNVANGGPRPVSDQNRRAIEPWVALELCTLGDLDQCDEETRHRREAEGDLYFDPFDSYEDELQEARSNAAVRLSGDMALALRQIRTGYQKWILRYISECNGQKLYGAHSKRLRKMTNKMQDAIDKSEDKYPDADFVANKWNENRFFVDTDNLPDRVPKQ